MRKAALIVGIVFAILAACGAMMKLADFPGGSLLIIFGTGFFCLVALPLQTIYNFRRNSDGLRRSADVLGCFAVWCLLCGLLYKAQAWPGAHIVLLTGLGSTAVFGILFFAASRRSNVETNWLTGFTITVILVIISLSLAWMEKSDDRIDIGLQKDRYNAELNKCKGLVNRTDELVAELEADGGWDKNDTLALTLHYEMIQVVAEIEQVKAGLVYESNMMAGADPNSGQIMRPEDIDVTTMYMVGSDFENPSGHGMRVYERLRYLRDNVIPEGITFAVPTSSDIEAQQQWTKDNFYHATVLEALTVLTKIETEIYTSLIYALEQRAYIE